LAGYHDAARLRGRLVSRVAAPGMSERRQEIYVHLFGSTRDRAPTLAPRMRAWL
jgi:hypothetical protein